MNSFACIMLPFLGLAFATAEQSVAQERDRTKIPDQSKWDLTGIYPSDEAWREAKTQFAVKMNEIDSYRGKLALSSKQLLGCLELANDLGKTFMRLGTYAGLKSDEDTRVQSFLAMKSELAQLSANFGAKLSFIEPEILKIETPVVEQFIAQEDGLKIYRHYLEDLLRRKAHTGTEGEEKIIADAGLMADAPGEIYSIFSNADFPYPEVALSDGTKVRLDASAFSLARTSQNRDDRKKVFEAFFSELNKFNRTFGMELSGNINRNIFYMKARKYKSSLESALDANNIPTAVYRSLVDQVNKNLPTFHRYLKLRQRMMGVDQLHYYDLYAPLVKGVDLNYTVDESYKNILAALAPLGDEYLNVAKKAFSERWIDVYPNDGKRSGAYSNGSAYDVHPFILLNYNGKYNDMSTIAHELGHTMHSYLSNKYQPYSTSQYSIFVAEVASTFNEALLIDYMLKIIKDDDVRLSLLGSLLENIKGTVFRQTQFAEFELQIHELAEKGEPITGEELNKIYFDLTKNYYGHYRNICVVDDIIQAEWIFIPHFYYNFYVYQYATAYTASAALSERVLAGEKGAVERYVKFLSSGCSEYPIELLKQAGVDMTTPEPFDLTMKKMNRVMDEMERILDKEKK